jgi:hypothetical protein
MGEIEDRIRSQYGYLAVYLDHPEIGPILRRAGAEGWTQDRLQAELYNTNWWRATAAATREWDLLNQSDPAEAQNRIEVLADQIRNIQTQAGLPDDYGYAKTLAWEFLRGGYSESQIKKASILRTGAPGAAGGQIAVYMTQAKQRGAEQGVVVSDQAAWDWGRQIAAGVLTPDAYEAYLRNQAKAQYSWLAPLLDKGATVRQLLDPIIQQTATLLETTPDTIQVTDPKFNPMFVMTDPNTNTQRSMTLSEAGTYVRRTEDWQQTDNARAAASRASESIIRTFGKVAV